MNQDGGDPLKGIVGGIPRPSEQAGAAEASEPSLLPTLNAPKGGGALRGIDEKFSSNLATGTASLRVPIPTPPGRGAFQLSLELAYDSGGGNGPFGLGWSLSTPTITRKTARGVPLYADDDVCLLSGAEDLVPTRDDEPKREGTERYQVRRYRPRTEGLFARIERWTRERDGDAHWRVTTGENVQHVYGRSTDARIADPEDAERVFSWLLEETRDDRGNIARYTYRAEDARGVDAGLAGERHRFPGPGATFTASAQRYLKRIDYGNASPGQANDWHYSVVLDYGDHDPAAPTPDPDPKRVWGVRADAWSSYTAGFEVRHYRLCERVLVFHSFDVNGGATSEPVLVRSTDLGYRTTKVASYLERVVQRGYVKEGAGYRSSALPTLELDYGRLPDALHDVPEALDAESLEGLRAGVDGSGGQWVDLDGEGLPGVLIAEQRAWYYKRNLGDGRLAAPALQRELPAPLELRSGAAQLSDVGSDGNLDLVQYSPPLAGFFARTDEGWETFRAFSAMPQLDWSSPQLRFVDVDGDGHADLLISENDDFVFYRSFGASGFAPPARVAKPHDEDEGPAVVFSDGTETIFLADMSGDGLSDIVRVRNSDVCYWPALGHGRFGRRVTLGRAGPEPFDRPERFDPKRIRLADIDGTGTSDVIYLGTDGIDVYFNECGNSLSEPQRLTSLPPADALASVSVVDLLGSGTACIVWSSSAPGQTAPVRYLDLLESKKPHLLERISDNTGAETRITYAPSTKHYLEDLREGGRWLTRLPFPVHVIDRVDAIDWLSRTSLVTRYRYHHGYYDGLEREFRGFARVDQYDDEVFGDERTPVPGAARDPAQDLVQPTVRTTSWFHTGVEPLADDLALEYWAGDPKAPQLVAPPLPEGGATWQREAARALRGALLRREVYSEDGTTAEELPYAVTELTHAVRSLPVADGAPHGVFFTHPVEQVELRYERNAADPRVHHQVTLEVDDFGNVREAVAVTYGRRGADPDLPQTFKDAQQRELVTQTKSAFTFEVDDDTGCRNPLPAETRLYEITGCKAAKGWFTPKELRDQLAKTDPIDYSELDARPPAGTRYRRRVQHTRTLYRSDDLSHDLALREAEPRGVVADSFTLCFTKPLLDDAFQRNGKSLLVDRDGMLTEAGYRSRTSLVAVGAFPSTDPDDRAGDWWMPRGRVWFSEKPTTAAAELQAARASFFSPRRSEDAFGSPSYARWDDDFVLVVETEDAAENITRAAWDYRVLQPRLVIDPNGNRTEAAFDALGQVEAVARTGKQSGPVEGDLLSGYSATPAAVAAFFSDPVKKAATLLGDASLRFVYDLGAFERSVAAGQSPQPIVSATIAREVHVSDGGGQGRAQLSFLYFDGFGRELQKKSRVEKGPLRPGEPDVDPRWATSGWAVYNNKGKPVRRYEPFFSGTHGFELARAEGAPTTLLYDPLDRAIGTLLPDHSYEKVVFDCWREEQWDRNDTVDLSPITDPHLKQRFALLPMTDTAPSWAAQHAAGDRLLALQRAREHAGTPRRVYLDSLGRPVLTVEHNRYRDESGVLVTERLPRFVKLDIEGLERETLDARRKQAGASLVKIHDEGRAVLRSVWDVAGRKVRETCLDAGERWTLPDVAGQPVYAWDRPGRRFHFEYDALRRSTRSSVQGHDPADPSATLRFHELTYGEGQPNAAQGNLKGRLFRVRDGAGQLTHVYDFKGNVEVTLRQLTQAVGPMPDWAKTVKLEPDELVTTTRFDALSRVAEVIGHDKSRVVRTYNEGGLLERVQVGHRGGALKAFIVAVAHDARGQRLAMEYGNGVTTEYGYEPGTFRLSTVVSRRAGGERLQDLSYTYDPVGNVSTIVDAAQPAIYFDNAVVEPRADYVYDASYQLKSATGREHAGRADVPESSWDEIGRVNPPSPRDGQKMRRYTETYAYDAAGNLDQLVHSWSGNRWTREYQYERDSRLEPGRKGNALTGTKVGASASSHKHDERGNMTSMGHLPTMTWDVLDRLASSASQVVASGSPGTTYFAYDYRGERVRKVTVAAGSLVKTRERVYVGPCELYIERDGAGATTLERESLHVAGDGGEVALIETKAGTAKPVVRYQLSNHLGSSQVEVDDSPDARIISYEEYYPFGSTSYQAQHPQITAPKRYRYIGKERDDETGLAYHGARYYAPWLGRWTSPDPNGLRDGVSRYLYARNSPTRLVDRDGRAATEPGPRVHAAWRAAEAAGYDGDSIRELNRAYEDERPARGQGLLVTQSSLEYATVRATAAESHLRRGNLGRAAFHGALALVETVGALMLAETPAKTARNILIGAGLARVFQATLGAAYNLGRYKSLLPPKVPLGTSEALAETATGSARTQVADEATGAGTQELDAMAGAGTEAADETASLGSQIAGKTAEEAGDHIVLGLRAYGLEQVAERVGGRTLLSDPSWKFTILRALGDAKTKFSVSLDGFAGASTAEKVLSAAQKGLVPGATPTNWEMAQLYQAGRLKNVTFFEKGSPVENPFK